MHANGPTLGAWDDDRAELATQPLEGVGLYVDQPEQIDFQTITLQILAKVVSKGIGPEARTPVYFVLADAEIFTRVRPIAASIPLLRSDDSINFFGQLWFVPRSVGHGYAMDTSTLKPAEVFKRIEELGGGRRPLIVVHPTKPTEAMLYPKGVIQPEECQSFDLTVTTVSVADIDSALNGLHSLIRSPDQSEQHPLWTDPAKFLPTKNAEKAVQHEVTRALAGRFGWFMDVRSEQPSSIGRTDVELIQSRGLPIGQNIRHALVELKVLRSFTAGGTAVRPGIMTRHISQGVRQASEYGEAANSKIRMLCCYDMRKNDEGTKAVFKDFEKPARDRNVLLRRYFLSNSSSSLRQTLDDRKVANGATALPG